MLGQLSATVGDLKARGVNVRWICQQCEASGLADLDRIVAAKGADYCLTDRTAACPAAGCTYWVTFYAQAQMTHWSLQTPAGKMRLMDRRTAWLMATWAAKGVT